MTFVHKQNLGYGRNQKTCYREALRREADIVVMVHADYQYSPRLIVAMAGMLAYGEYDVALASRILGTGALRVACLFINIFPTGFLPCFKIWLWAASCQSTTLAIAHFRARCWKRRVHRDRRRQDN